MPLLYYRFGDHKNGVVMGIISYLRDLFNKESEPQGAYVPPSDIGKPEKFVPGKGGRVGGTGEFTEEEVKKILKGAHSPEEFGTPEPQPSGSQLDQTPTEGWKVDSPGLGNVPLLRPKSQAKRER